MERYDRIKKVAFIIVLICVIPIAGIICYALISSGNSIALVYFFMYLSVCVISGLICSAISQSRGMEGGFLWGFFLGIIGIIIVAVRPHDDQPSPPIEETEIATPPLSNADELKKFKELYDSGVITQEEFDAKKKQLLDL